MVKIEAEVVKKDSSNWRSVSVDNIFVNSQTKATATLVSPLPTDPIPEGHTNSLYSVRHSRRAAAITSIRTDVFGGGIFLATTDEC